MPRPDSGAAADTAKTEVRWTEYTRRHPVVTLVAALTIALLTATPSIAQITQNGTDSDLSITKTDGVTSAEPGGLVTYTIVVTNLGPFDTTADGVEVTDTFPSDLSCSWTSVFAGGATGSTTSGTGNITNATPFTMPVSSTITFTVSCVIAAGATGTLSNTASVGATEGTTDPTPGNNSATDNDTVLANIVPTFSKAFAPDPILPGGTSTLTFTIGNTASTVPANSLAFTDTLPTGVVVATTPNTSSNCSVIVDVVTSSIVTATPGAGVITYTGGSVGAGASCTVEADVTSSTVGTHVNTTGDLTSSKGNSGTASDNLTVTGGTITIVKNTVPDDPQDFAFTTTGGAESGELQSGRRRGWDAVEYADVQQPGGGQLHGHGDGRGGLHDDARLCRPPTRGRRRRAVPPPSTWIAERR